MDEIITNGEYIIKKSIIKKKEYINDNVYVIYIQCDNSSRDNEYFIDDKDAKLFDAGDKVNVILRKIEEEE